MVQEETEKKLDELTLAKDWMIRPCLLYNDEYKDCKSIRARLHQWFVFGEFSDCSQWKRDYDNCNRWSKSNNVTAFKELVTSEESRRRERLDAHYENNVWERREKPPESWNEPLPDWLAERTKNTYLAFKAEELKNSDGISERSFCVIS